MNRDAVISPEIEATATEVVDAAFAVHTALGPGLLESIYETCLCHELTLRGIQHRQQVLLPLVYRGLQLDDGLRLDLLVRDHLVVEIKAVEKHHLLFESQLLSYLKLSGHRLGLLINFNTRLIKDGIRRMIR